MPKQKPIEDLVAGWNKFTRPDIGQKFEHYKGGVYEIVATGFLEESERPCVVYKSLEKNIVWVRTAQNFFDNIEHDGHSRPRFIAID